MTRYLLTLPLILLITLSLSNPSNAQWERHELPIFAGAGYGEVEISDIDFDGDVDAVGVAYDFAFAINHVPDDPYDFDILEKADIDNDGDVDLFNEHIYWYENPTNDPPQFIIRLVPRQTIIPSGGGEVVFDGMVYNQFSQPINGHLWADVTGPNGNRARIWHRRMTFPNGEWLTWPNLGLAVPGGLPGGEYRMTVRAGALGYGFVPGDSLRFVKEAGRRPVSGIW
ncbi:hypothetical protein KQI52_15210 [bacterium]|nr:hypothetical protein [bacterium]